MRDPVEYEYETLRQEGTGSHGKAEETRTVVYPFDRYSITVELTADNRFVGIVAVTVNRAFLNHRQRLAALTKIGYHDVEEYYKEDEVE